MTVRGYLISIDYCPFLYPLQTVFVGGGYTVFTLSISPSVCGVLVFQFGKHVNIHKMNIYNRKIRARGQFF